MKKPLIGITPRSMENGTKRGNFCEKSYADAIILAGGIPIILPITNDEAIIDGYLASCQGIVISGGGDMDEKYYDPPISKRDCLKLSNVDVTRDKMEISLIQKAVAKDLPVLGICRGLQVMNVAFGGTLLPDIPNHQCPEPSALAHRIQWHHRGVLWKALDGYEQVNTSHHQAVAKLANGFDIAAQAPDGIIEAIEMKKTNFACGVQFHPERLICVASQFLGLFKTFVAQSQKQRSQNHL